jgi:hypothetical protein
LLGLLQVVKWRAIMLSLSEQGASILPQVQQDLQGVTDADMLDVLFESPGLGQVLLKYAAASPNGAVSYDPPKRYEFGFEGVGRF